MSGGLDNGFILGEMDKDFDFYLYKPSCRSMAETEEKFTRIPCREYSLVYSKECNESPLAISADIEAETILQSLQSDMIILCNRYHVCNL